MLLPQKFPLKKRLYNELLKDSVKAKIDLEMLPISEQQKKMNESLADFVFFKDSESLIHLRWVLEKGANVHQQIDTSQKVIHRLFSVVGDLESTREILKNLIEFGANIEERTKPFNPKFYQDLPDVQENPEENQQGNTPFLVCAQFGFKSGAQVLYEAGADILAQNGKGEGFLDIYRMYQFNLSHQDEKGELLKWFIALPEGHQKMIEQLRNPTHRREWIEKNPQIVLDFLSEEQRKRLERDLLDSTVHPPPKVRL